MTLKANKSHKITVKLNFEILRIDRCFERIDNGPKNKGAVFQHPYFIRGQKHICENMTRDSFKRSNTSSSSLSSIQYQQRSLSQQAIAQAHQAAKLQQQRQRLQKERNNVADFLLRLLFGDDLSRHI